jgi:uncharacterized membrane protein
MSFDEVFYRFVLIFGPLIIVGAYLFTIGKRLPKKTKITHLIIVYIVWLLLAMIYEFIDNPSVAPGDNIPKETIWLSVGALMPILYCTMLGVVMGLSKEIDYSSSDNKVQKKLDTTIIVAIISAVSSVIVALITKLL